MNNEQKENKLLLEVGDLYVENDSPFGRITYLIEKEDGLSIARGKIFRLRRFIENIKPDTCYMYESDIIMNIKDGYAELVKHNKDNKN